MMAGMLIRFSIICIALTFNLIALILTLIMKNVQVWLQEIKNC